MVIVGAGAIGLSVAGWIFPHNVNLHLLARGESVAAIRSYGLQLYQVGQEATSVPLPVKVIESLDEISSPDIIIVTVKNYDLDGAAQSLRRKLGGCQPIVASLQNGLENQRILPRYFSRAIYGVVCYNAWREGVGRVSFVKRGYVIVGTPKNDLQAELQAVQGVFRSWVRLLCD